ncbi:MAG: histidine triad nucleotide-binding protein [Gemmatimonadota bacterium]|nr:histidine triad nucleotide-binding protein [Gemmatimonadota bacterium]
MSSEADCLFCGIVEGRIPADLVREDDHTVAFKDINPQAPVHVLVIPRKHMPSLDVSEPDDQALLGELLLRARDVARAEGIAESGYRTVVNTGDHGGQTVDHLHVHVLGGRAMQWPPG